MSNKHSGFVLVSPITATVAVGSNYIPLSLTLSDTTYNLDGIAITQNNASGNMINLNNNGTGDALRIRNDGVLAANKHALEVVSVANQTNAGVTLVLFSNTGTGTSKRLLELRQSGTAQSLFVRHTGTSGTAMDIDRDGNSSSSIIGLGIDADNIGSGGVTGVNISSVSSIGGTTVGLSIAEPTGGSANYGLQFPAATSIISTSSTTISSVYSEYIGKQTYQSASSGILTATITNGGSGYTVNDILTVTTGGTGGTVTATNVSLSGQISAISLNNGGLGYTVGNLISINGGISGVFTVSTVDGSGTILTLSLSDAGSGYSTGTAIATTGGSGTGALIDISSILATGQVTSIAVTTAGSGYTIGSGKSTTGGTGSGCTINIGSLTITSTTVTNAAALYIEDAPAAGSNITITNSYALQLASTSGLASGGITFGTDTNLYRNAANSLEIVGGLTLTGSETVNTIQSPTDTDLTIDSYGTGLLKLNSISQATIFVGAPIECDGSGTFTGISMDANPSAGGAGQPFFLNAGNAASGATNKNGGALIFSAGESTGSGKSAIRFSASVNNTGSTSYNSAVNRLVLNSQVALTSGAAATLLTIPLATLQMAGGILVYTIDCSDGTDMICDSGSVYFAAVNKGGVYTTNSSLLGTDATAKSDITDTISNVFSFSNGSNQTLFQITSTITGQTPTTFRITYQLTSGAYQSITAP